MPGYQAQRGFLCKSVLLFPTLISRSWMGWKPQQPLVVILTTRTACGIKRSTLHHGDGSFCVSEHSWPSGFWLPSFPSLAKLAGPALVADDWFTGFRKATFVPVEEEIKITDEVTSTLPLATLQTGLHVGKLSSCMSQCVIEFLSLSHVSLCHLVAQLKK